MKEYISPIIVDLDITETAEGIFAGSGVTDSDTPGGTQLPPLSQSSCWSFSCHWDSHNNEDSVLQVSGSHSGDHSGQCIVLYFRTTFPIGQVTDASGFSITPIDDYHFSLTRNNFFNPSESGVGFAIRLTRKDGDTQKPIGAENATIYYCEVERIDCF